MLNNGAVTDINESLVLDKDGASLKPPRGTSHLEMQRIQRVLESSNFLYFDNRIMSVNYTDSGASLQSLGDDASKIYSWNW